ncbi:hypothetical protein GF402_10555 [Candidatus Fermentibacteria bacterium]|nr:hypothetical protein [Candidatus Fermentibacteria bacterium]
MKDFEEAAELASAFSRVLREISTRFSDAEHLPVSNDSDFRSYQNLIARLILIQRDLDDLIDMAVTLEDTSDETPLQIMDFSREWEGFD